MKSEFDSIFSEGRAKTPLGFLFGTKLDLIKDPRSLSRFINQSSLGFDCGVSFIPFFFIFLIFSSLLIRVSILELFFLCQSNQGRFLILTSSSLHNNYEINEVFFGDYTTHH